MKKRISLFLLPIIALFFSCQDNSGDFAEQLFTNTEITAALQLCLDSAALHTCNILCVVDTVNEKLGYSYYDSKSYRIALPAAAKSVVDTLAEEYSERIDSLINNINRAAEQCGNQIMIRFWKALADSIVFPNPYATLHGGNSAITDYVKQIKEKEFIAVLINSVLIDHFTDLDVIKTWNELQKIYTDKTGIYSSVDILTPAAQQMVTGFFKQMALQEEAIREKPALQGNSTGLLRRVFATL